MNARRWFVCAAILASLILPALSDGQTSQSALAGVVKDTTGAVLPGVTVEAASPALIERVRSVTTDSAGLYRIVDLRPGTYTITFSLPGFNSVRVENFDLRADFIATVNADMKVGELNETITVSGEAPLVDVQSTTQAAPSTTRKPSRTCRTTGRFRASRRRFPASSAARTSTAPRRAACRCTAAASPKRTARLTACPIAAARPAARRSPST